MPRAASVIQNAGPTPPQLVHSTLTSRGASVGRQTDGPAGCCPRRCPGTVQRPENPRFTGASVSTATGIRTRVSAVRGRRPSPLDDGGPADDCSRGLEGPLVPSVG